MKRLYIGSMNRHSGKTLLTLGLSIILKEMGHKIGYVKPLGNEPLIKAGKVVDANALFFKEALGLDEPVEALCPIVLTLDSMSTALSGKTRHTAERILKSIKSIKNKDILFITGTSDLFEGSVFGTNGIRIIKETAAGAIMVEAWNNEETLDDIIGAKEILGEKLDGIILNRVREDSQEFIKKKVKPFLKRHNIELLGTIPDDPLLKAVTVKALVNVLGGKVICAEDRLDGLVENFSIGAMDVDNALKYFRRTPNKAVITGAHRADIQLAALDTSTKCIILTGGLQPNDVIIGNARLKGVPIIIVNEDTYTAVERIEGILGKMKIREKEKLDRIRQLVGDNIDINGMLKKIGQKKEKG
ncbi:MAG: phosphotransacetylase family protein [Nitrospiraceae bacterium]|nr:MAG: phosphotransacetylase family protein [Nitrospiraceae bacterium]